MMIDSHSWTVFRNPRIMYKQFLDARESCIFGKFLGSP